MFLVALSFAYFAKALSGSYMKSTITQLERRFDIPSYLVGVIDGSFEIGKHQILSLENNFNMLFEFGGRWVGDTHCSLQEADSHHSNMWQEGISYVTES